MMEVTGFKNDGGNRFKTRAQYVINMEPRCSKRCSDNGQVFLSLHKYASLNRSFLYPGAGCKKTCDIKYEKICTGKLSSQKCPHLRVYPCSSAASGSGIGVLMGVA
jgi:hypothetical protein